MTGEQLTSRQAHDHHGSTRAGPDLLARTDLGSGGAGSDGGTTTVADRVRRRAARGFLPEVQALRMWAVGFVVAFHLWPSRFPGGFTGVDAFFVISGYLITSHLVREVERTGTVHLGAFYARRARRLLPASMTVLLVSIACSFALLPDALRAMTGREALASTFYVQNLWLAQVVLGPPPPMGFEAPVQHYWSLSTEEQFYLLWPPLILLALWLARRARGAAARPVRAAGTMLAVVTALSLVLSVWYTATHPANTYFMTFTRAWEFAAGGLLPMVLRRWAPSTALSLVLRYVGLAMIVASAFVLSQGDPFPGHLALLPVLGTAAVILAGDCDGRDPLDLAWTNRTSQWLGDISYSIYLWHWPLIVLVPFAVHRDLDNPLRLAVAALTVALAHVWWRWVEDATRFLPGVRQSTGRSLLLALGSMVVVGAAALALALSG
ncbi:acyltransferase family protein [Arsenicicoccus dermatophilus]|uniref:acyltransferase family protein n=1 Tax=Arsenicicoccus dermatophilus TaxID=1076331 RepID=UPI00391745B9